MTRGGDWEVDINISKTLALTRIEVGLPVGYERLREGYPLHVRLSATDLSVITAPVRVHIKRPR